MFSKSKNHDHKPKLGMTEAEAYGLRDRIAKVSGDATVGQDAEGVWFVTDARSGVRHYGIDTWLTAMIARQEAMAVLSQYDASLTETFSVSLIPTEHEGEK